jgi:hypothetical protein
MKGFNRNGVGNGSFFNSPSQDGGAWPNLLKDPTWTPSESNKMKDKHP